ncbi:MAG: PAS domain S-box protein [Balneolaceae bacterium]
MNRRTQLLYRDPLVIVGIYLMAGFLWIFLSDLFLPAPVRVQQLQTVKGIGYVSVTALLLYWLIQRNNNALAALIDDLESVRTRLGDIVEHSNNMFYAHDPDGNLTYLSPQSETFLGIPSDEIGISWETYVTDRPENKIGHERTTRALKTGERQPPYELELQKPDGTKLWVEVNEAPVVRDGDVIQMVGALIDITDQKRAEEESRRYQELLEKLTNQAGAAIWIREPGGRYIFVNRGFRTLFGLNGHRILGKSVDEIHTPEVAAMFRENDRQVLESDLPVILEEMLEIGEMKPHWYRTNLFPLRDIPGLSDVIGGVAIDITEQKEGEEVIRASLQEKETLLSEIHHRVKNNLAVVSSLLELQAMHLTDPDQREELLKGTVRIKSMATIHEQLYQSENFSRISFENGVETLIQTIVETLRVGVDVDLKFDLAPLNLSINQAVPFSLLINEVMTNILKHAFRGRTHGVIRIRLREGPSERIQLEIEDDGPVFVPGRDQEVSGTMGLALIQLLTKQLKGEYRYHETDNGTRFTLSFDRSDEKGSGSFFVR